MRCPPPILALAEQDSGSFDAVFGQRRGHTAGHYERLYRQEMRDGQLAAFISFRQGLAYADSGRFSVRLAQGTCATRTQSFAFLLDREQLIAARTDDARLWRLKGCPRDVSSALGLTTRYLTQGRMCGDAALRRALVGAELRGREELLRALARGMVRQYNWQAGIALLLAVPDGPMQPATTVAARARPSFRTPDAVPVVCQELCRLGLVDFQPGQGVQLTSDGGLVQRFIGEARAAT